MTLHIHPAHAITSQLVLSHARLDTLPKVFGPTLGIRVEQTVFNFMHKLCRDYCGGFWEFHQLSNQGFFMTPPTAGAPYLIRAENEYAGRVSAEAAGIIVCLYTYSHMSFEPGLWALGDHFGRLRAFALDHTEAAAIFAAID